ncbi:MAG: hypothetical protein ACRDQ4_17035 [Pseudonocardiaceae bacterium]
MTSAQGTVTRHWGTGLVISEVDLTGILQDSIASDLSPADMPFAQIPPSSVVADEAALRAEFLASMNALADSHGSPPVTDVELDVQVWRGGYDLPATSYAADFVGWCFLATSSTPQHSESGAIAIADPRAGSALTAMPGLPWGRQVMISPTPGAHAAVPGWLTCSVVPLEQGQHAIVAIAASVR